MRQALRGLNATSPRDVRKAIDEFTHVYYEDAHPSEWTKDVVYPGQLKHKYADLCNQVLHPLFNWISEEQLNTVGLGNKLSKSYR